MWRLGLIILLLTGLVVAISVGTGIRHEEAEFRFISRGPINSLDPAQMAYMQDIQAATAIWEGLTRPHPETCAPLEGVAYLPPAISEDGKRYVFTLRPEARWSNGEQVVADDFIRGWRRAIEPGTADAYAELISAHIAGAQNYVEWRNACIEVLGVIRPLQKKAPLKSEQVGKAFQRPDGKVLMDVLKRKLPEPLPSPQDPYWGNVLEDLRQARADWKVIGDQLLDAHLVEMDRRFAKVGMKAIDDRHVEMILAKLTPYLYDLTSFSTYLPVHKSIELLRDRYEDRPLTDLGVWSYDQQWPKPDYHKGEYRGVITNGPYVLAKWDFKQRLRYEANPYYWDKAGIKSRTVEAIEFEYQNAAFLMYEQGLTDMMLDLAMDYTPELVRLGREGRRDDVHAIPSFGTYFLTINCLSQLPDGRQNPLVDRRLRKALALATNKKEIVDHVVRLGNPVADTFVPRDQIRGYRSPRGLGFAPEQARALLAEAGYPDGQGLPVIEFFYNTGFNQEAIAQAIKRIWERELNIRVQLVGKETKTFAEDKTMHRFMVARGGWFGDYLDPTTFLDLFRSESGHNSAGFKDEKYDGMLNEAGREINPGKRMDMLTEAERYLVEEQAPVVPIHTYVLVCTWRPGVTGIYPNPRAQYPIQYYGMKR